LGGITISLCDNETVAQEIATKCKDLISDYWIEEI
ncbi:MAG: mevalonate kinase, partial [Lactobacillus crispatus]|nr:mevalonate kinase [Lactobacillus crispatus]